MVYSVCDSESYKISPPFLLFWEHSQEFQWTVASALALVGAWFEGEPDKIMKINQKKTMHTNKQNNICKKLKNWMTQHYDMSTPLSDIRKSLMLRDIFPFYVCFLTLRR